MQNKVPTDLSRAAARRQGFAWADRMNELEGLGRRTPVQKRYDEKVIAGEMTHAEAVEALKRDFYQRKGVNGGR